MGESRPVRRLLRFSTRSFLAAVIVVALVCWLHLRAVDQSIRRWPGARRQGIHVEVDVVAVDGESGAPIPGARVEVMRLPLGAEDGDSDVDVAGPGGRDPRRGPWWTDEHGHARVVVLGSLERGREHWFHGLIPTVGDYRLSLDREEWIRVHAEGFASRSGRADDALREPDRRVAPGGRIVVAHRLRRAPAGDAR